MSQGWCVYGLDSGAKNFRFVRSSTRITVQRKVRRAEREALRYEEGTSEILLQHFYKLMITTRRRQGLPPQPLSWFRSLVTSMGRNAQIRVALKQRRPLPAY